MKAKKVFSAAAMHVAGTWILCALLLACQSGNEATQTDDNFGLPSEAELINLLINDPNIDKPSCAPEQWIDNTHSVEFYTDRQSYEPGEFVSFHVHSPHGNHALSVVNIALDPSAWRLHYQSDIRGMPQDFKCYDYSWGLTWESTYGFVIPETAKSGEYIVTVTDTTGTRGLGALVIRPAVSVSKKPIVFVVPTNTWAAYNGWGGGSFYRHYIEEGRPRSSIVSFARPNRAIRRLGHPRDHLLNADRQVLIWLEQQGFAYDVVSDADLHEHPEILEGYKVAILGPHSEYWSYRMYMGLRDYVTAGGHLIVSGANSIYWKVNLRHNRIEVRKEGDDFAYGPGHGGLWRDLGFPEAGIIGVAYDERGYDTFAPYVVQEPDHWAFADIALPDNLQFGHSGMTGGAASGWETDKITADSPSTTVLLARGSNPDDGGADMVLVPGANGRGSVFSAGSITFSGSLLIDSVSSGILKNVVTAFLAD